MPKRPAALACSASAAGDIVSVVTSTGSIPPGTLAAGGGPAVPAALVAAERRRLASLASGGQLGGRRLLRRRRRALLRGGATSGHLARRLRRLGGPGSLRRGRLREVEQVLDPLDLRYRGGLRLELVDLLGVLRLAAQPYDAVGRVDADLALCDLGGAEELRLDLARDRHVVERLGLPARAALFRGALLALLLRVLRRGVVAAAAGHRRDGSAEDLGPLLNAEPDDLRECFEWIGHTCWVAAAK